MLDRVFIEETNVFFINDCIGLFQKYFDSLCYPFKVLHKHCFQFFLGAIVNPKGKRKQCLVRKIFKGQQRVLWYLLKWPMRRRMGFQLARWITASEVIHLKYF